MNTLEANLEAQHSVNPNQHITFFDYEISEEITPDYLLSIINEEMKFEEATFVRLQIMCGNTDNKDTIAQKQNLRDAYKSALSERKRFFNYIKETQPSAKYESLINKYTISINSIKNYTPYYPIYKQNHQPKVIVEWKIYSTLLTAVALIYGSLLIFK